MVLVIGGIVPAYAQFVGAVDRNGVPSIAFWDYDDPPQCIEMDVIAASGAGFTPHIIVDIDLTLYPNNGNINGNFAPGGFGYDYVAAGALIGDGRQVTIDATGGFTNVQLIGGPTPSLYNIIVDTNQDGVFNPNHDTIDMIDFNGLTVFSCEQQNLFMKQNSVPTRDAQLGHSVDIAGANLPTEDSSKTRGLNLLYAAAVGDGTQTITDLSDISVWFKEVHIDTNGEFTETITWTPTTTGIYNIILDMNNDDIYDPNIDIIDYPAEVGFTVTTDMDHLACSMTFEGYDIAWYEYLIPGFPQIEFIMHPNNDFNFAVYPCSDDLNFGLGGIVSVLIHGNIYGTVTDVDDFNNDGHPDTAFVPLPSIDSFYDVVLPQFEFIFFDSNGKLPFP